MGVQHEGAHVVQEHTGAQEGREGDRPGLGVVGSGGGLRMGCGVQYRQQMGGASVMLGSGPHLVEGAEAKEHRGKGPPQDFKDGVARGAGGVGAEQGCSRVGGAQEGARPPSQEVDGDETGEPLHVGWGHPRAEAEGCPYYESTGRCGKDDATTSTLVAEGPVCTHDEAGVALQGVKVAVYVHR